MGWYLVVKTVKGHRYLYRQRSWRVGGKVKTESRYLGRAGAGGEGRPKAVLTPQPTPSAGARKEQPASTAPNVITPVNPYVGRLIKKHSTSAPVAEHVPPPKAIKRKGRTAKRPITRFPKDRDFSDPFWDMPRTPMQLRRQAVVVFNAHRALEKKYDGFNLFQKALTKKARADRKRLRELKQMLDWYQHKATSHFDRHLLFTKRGVVLKRSE